MILEEKCFYSGMAGAAHDFMVFFFFCLFWDGNSQGRRLVNEVGVTKNKAAIK